MHKVVKTMLALLFVSLVSVSLPHAVGMLGVSVYAATKLVDAVMMGASIYTIIGLIVISGGAAGVAIGGIRYMIGRFGRRVAINW